MHFSGNGSKPEKAGKVLQSTTAKTDVGCACIKKTNENNQPFKLYLLTTFDKHKKSPEVKLTTGNCLII